MIIPNLITVLFALLGSPLFIVISALASLAFHSVGIDLSVIVIEMSRLADTPLLVSLPLLYGVIPTLQPAHFGRVYAAYGGVFIVLSILWGWKIDKIAPDRFDIIGGLVALVGVSIIMYWPRPHY